MKFGNYNIYSLISYLVAGSLLMLTACEDVIDVDLDDGTPQVAVDAFITDIEGEQVIRLTRTTPYFDNTTQSPLLGATVQVTDQDGNTFFFEDIANTGEYSWSPGAGDTLVKAGNTYTLRISYDGNTFVSTTEANPVPTIDSIAVEYREGDLGEEEGYYASLHVRDFAGRDDYYWIRSFKNSFFDASPERINVSSNAAFSGDGADGLLFILPIREAITNPEEPYDLGDTVRVELWAITEQTFRFLQEVSAQLRNDGLFATPSSNVRTNIANANPTSNEVPVGWFSVASASVAAVVIEE